MRRWALLLFLFLHVGFTCNAYAITTLKVGVYENKPLVFTDNDGKVKGFLIDILEYIGEKEGWHLEYVPGYWAECLERIRKGEIDILLGIEYSRERNELYDFTFEAILLDQGVVYTRQGFEVNQIANLDQKKIAVNANTTSNVASCV